jgi:flagellar biosynthesis GTPase FlhF
MEAEKISNFGILSLLTDERKSALDCLMPFIEYGLKNNQGGEYVETETLKGDIKNLCMIDIPIPTLITLLKRLSKENKIIPYEKYRYFHIAGDFSKAASEYEEKLHSFAREISQFVDACRKYNNFTVSNEELIDALYMFIAKYQHYIDTAQDKLKLEDTDPEALFQGIIKYVEFIMSSDEHAYNTFKNIFYGYLLTQFVARSKETPDFRKVRNLTVYIDTDFLLRILDFQAGYFTTTSKELFTLMRNSGIHVVVIPEIIAEMKEVLYRHLLSYSKNKKAVEINFGPLSSRFDGIDGAFYRRGLSLSEIQDYIDNLERNISDIGITLATKIPESIKKNEEEFEAIVSYKIEKFKSFSEQEQEKALEHIKKRAELDAMMLEHIRRLRGNKVQRFQDAGYLLLTCDNAIYRTNHSRHHDSTIEECMNETILTNTLFLCNPINVGDVPVNLLLSLFKSSDYLDYSIFRRFNAAVKRYLERDPEDTDYATKIYSNQKLFSEINNAYSTDEFDETEEMLFMKELFEKAKAEAKTEEQAKKSTEAKIQKQDELIEKGRANLEGSENKRQKLSSQVLDSERKIRELEQEKQEQKDESELKDAALKRIQEEAEKKEQEVQEYKSKAERNLRLALSNCFIVAIISAVIICLIVVNPCTFHCTLKWFTKLSLNMSYVVFTCALFMQVTSEEIENLIVQHYIYENKSKPLKPRLIRAVLIAIGITFTTFIIPVIEILYSVFH